MPNLDPDRGVDVEDSSSLTRIFSPLMSVIWVTIESGSPRTLNAASRRGDVGEGLLVGVAHLLFGGVKVSWPFKGDDVAMPPNPRGDGERLKWKINVTKPTENLQRINFMMTINLTRKHIT